MIEPYLNLSGRAAEAMDFYAGVFGGGDRRMERLEGSGLVSHGTMRIRGTTLHFSDLQPGELSEWGRISLLLTFDDPEDLTRVYHGLLPGAEVLMALGEEPFARLFAWVKDGFGVHWQLMLP